MVVEFGWQVFSKCLNCDSGILQRLPVKVESEKESNLVTLKIFFSAVKLPIVFKEVEAELEAATGVGPINDGQDTVEQLWISYFHGKQDEYFDLVEVCRYELVFRNADDKLTEEVEVEFGSYLLVNTLVDVVVLV